MSTDQRQPSSDEPSRAGNYQAQQWLAAFRRHDRDAFATIVRHLEYRVVSYLYWKHDLTLERSCELTRDTLEHAWKRLRAGEKPKDLLPWLYGIADNRRAGRLQRVAAATPARGPDFETGSELCVLDVLAGTEIDLDQHLPIWLEIMHDAVDSMPATLRGVIGTFGTRIGRDGLGDQRDDTIATLIARLDRGDVEASRFAEEPHLKEALDTLLQTAGVQLMARTRGTGGTDCAGFNMCLSDAGWEDGPFGAELQPLLQHVGVCDQGICQTMHVAATTLAGQLPVVVLLLAVGLDEQHRQLVETIYAEAPHGAADSATTATGLEHHAVAMPAVPLTTQIPSPTGLSSLLATRLAQLPGAKTAAEVVQQYPQLAQYVARGTAATVAAAVITVATISSGPSLDGLGLPGIGVPPTPSAKQPVGSDSPAVPEVAAPTPSSTPTDPADPASPLLSLPGGSLQNLPGELLGSLPGQTLPGLPGGLLETPLGGSLPGLPGQPLPTPPGAPLPGRPGQLLSTLSGGSLSSLTGELLSTLSEDLSQVLPDELLPPLPSVLPLPTPATPLPEPPAGDAPEGT